MKWTINAAKVVPDGIVVGISLVSEVADPIQVAPFPMEIIAPIASSKADIVALCNRTVADVLARQTKQLAAAGNAVAAAGVVASLTGTSASV